LRLVNLTLGVWIGNCVGYSNTHLFLLFILVNNLLLAYSSYLHYLVFSHKVAEIRLFQKQTIASFGAALHSVKLRSTYQLYTSVILEAEMGGALFLICAMICAVTAGFMLHHCWLLSTGTTTNESFKWADLKDALAAGEIVILDQDDPFMYAFISIYLTI
jgi:palmitoyltransferase ZDHHC4